MMQLKNDGVISSLIMLKSFGLMHLLMQIFSKPFNLTTLWCGSFSEKASKKSTQSFKKYEFVENQINNEIRFYQITTIS